MKHSIWPWAIGVAAVVAGLGGVVLLTQPTDEPAPVQTAEAEAEPLEIPAEEIPIEPQEPVVEIPEPVPQEPQEPEAPPLPELDASDEEMRQFLAQLFGAGLIDQFLIGDNLVRHIVVTIDNMARDHVSERQRPLRPVPGQFVTSASEEDAVEEEPIFLEPENYGRYTPLVQAIRDIDAAVLIRSYHRLYPLFREAYSDLGHPSGNFNHRLVEVIDHLLETPDVREPVKLVRPNVLYEFADDELEALSPGQKALIRMGADNAAVVKRKLREIRAEVIAEAGADDL